MSILKYFRPTKEKLELPDPWQWIFEWEYAIVNCIVSECQGEGCTRKTNEYWQSRALSDNSTCPEVSYRKGSSRMWHNGSNSILSKEISRFTVEGDRQGHGRNQFLFRKEAQFHPSLRSIFLYICDILVPQFRLKTGIPLVYLSRARRND